MSDARTPDTASSEPKKTPKPEKTPEPKGPRTPPAPRTTGRGNEADDARREQREEVKREVGEARTASPDDRDDSPAAPASPDDGEGARPESERAPRGFEDDPRAGRDAGGSGVESASSGNDADDDRAGRAEGVGPGEAKGPAADPRQGEPGRGGRGDSSP